VADCQLGLLAALETFENLKASFSKAGATQFGSGWAWLCVQKAEKLKFVVLKPRQSINAWRGRNTYFSNGFGNMRTI
jgi:superoxide dismutase